MACASIFELLGRRDGCHRYKIVPIDAPPRWLTFSAAFFVLALQLRPVLTGPSWAFASSDKSQLAVATLTLWILFWGLLLAQKCIIPSCWGAPNSTNDSQTGHSLHIGLTFACWHCHIVYRPPKHLCQHLHHQPASLLISPREHDP